MRFLIGGSRPIRRRGPDAATRSGHGTILAPKYSGAALPEEA
jgi:hypothetical protein